MRARLACASFLMAAAASVASAQDYDVFQIPLPPGWSSLFPLALNDQGHAVGIHTGAFNQMPKAFYFDGQSSYEFAKDFLESLPYETWEVGARPLDINNHGHVLLIVEILGVGGFPYVWDGQDFHAVQPAVPGSVGASSINNHGVLSGTYNHVNSAGNLENRGWIHDPGIGSTTIIEPEPPWTDSSASQVSDTGYISGFLMGGPLAARGFVWKDGVMTMLGTVDADDFLSMGSGVNDAGNVAGFTTNSPPPGTPSLSRVMKWNSSGDVVHWAYPTDNLTGFDVASINDADEIVGTMYGPQQPFHFQGGVIRNLNDHFEQPVAGLTLDLWDAYDINSSGQIVVQGQFLGGGDWNNYGFILTPTPSGCAGGATSYCMISPNSVGPGATIGYLGSTDVAAGDFVLEAVGVPPHQFGLFFYGSVATRSPFGDGWLCVGGGTTGIHRLPVVAADGSGSLTHAVDFTVPPAGSGPGQILGGSSWLFQAWYRDSAAGGAGFNLSDGLDVLFCP